MDERSPLPPPPPRKRARPCGEAEGLAVLLESRGAEVHHLAPRSWVAVLRGFRKPRADGAEFETTWAEHPSRFRTLVLFGREVELPRWQQAYGASYAFSGSVSEAIAPTPLVRELLALVNDVLPPGESSPFSFNTALCNWYAPEHYIGPHSDDVRQLVHESPIASLSWGLTRRFILTPKCKEHRKLELELRNGDLVIMGGACQATHKHEIAKLRRGEARGNRINFTFRCFSGGSLGEIVN